MRNKVRQRVRLEPEAQQCQTETTFSFDGKTKQARPGQWAVWINGRRHMPIIIDDIDFRTLYVKA